MVENFDQETLVHTVLINIVVNLLRINGSIGKIMYVCSTVVYSSTVGIVRALRAGNKNKEAAVAMWF